MIKDKIKVFTQTKILFSSLKSDNYNNIVFLDCEASGLDPNSYPIEIGFAWLNGKTENYLLKPKKEWKQNKTWNTESEKIHKISIKTLIEKGSDINIVIPWSLNIMKTNIVFSDNPQYETMWMNTLYETSKHKQNLTILDTKLLIIDILNKNNITFEKYNIIKENTLLDFPFTHRASNDALFYSMLIKNLLNI